jgi:hypothetical protein
VSSAFSGPGILGTNTIDWVGVLTICKGACIKAPLDEELFAWMDLCGELLAKYGGATRSVHIKYEATATG